MPSPKDGTAGTLVEPAPPVEAKDADVADPGTVETVKAGEREAKTGKYGTTPVKPFKPQPEEGDGSFGSDAGAEGVAGSGSVPQPGETTKKVWIEIVLVDDNDKPVAGEAYKVTLPDDSVKEGTLDDKGFARVDGCDPGTCKVTFPMMDGRSWKKA